MRPVPPFISSFAWTSVSFSGCFRFEVTDISGVGQEQKQHRWESKKGIRFAVLSDGLHIPSRRISFLIEWHALSMCLRKKGIFRGVWSYGEILVESRGLQLLSFNIMNNCATLVRHLGQSVFVASSSGTLCTADELHTTSTPSS
jgi:hypothetical protein